MSMQPHGENVRNAVKFIADERKYNPDKKSIKALADEACLKYDLSPKEADYVMRFVMEGKE